MQKGPSAAAGVGGHHIGWLVWLRVAEKHDATIRLRADNIRSIARRSGAATPSEITLSTLVMLCSERPWSAEHRKSRRSLLTGFFDWATATGTTATNPAIGLPKISASHPRPRSAPDDICFELLETAPAREQLMARLAGEAGLRRAEVAATATT